MEASEVVGAGIFTLIYFGILYVLHGPLVRLAFIALIILVQLSYQVQYPKFVWDPVGRASEHVRGLWAGLWVGEAQIAAAMNRGGQRRRVRGDARRWKTPLGWRVMGWAGLALCAWVAFHLMFDAATEESPLLSRLHMPVPPTVGAGHSPADKMCEEAQTLEFREEWAQVVVRLEAALQLDGNNTCALYNYGRLLQYHWHQPDKAEDMYWRALASNPKHVPTLRNLAYLLLIVRKSPKKAEELFEAALLENPREIDVLSGYGSLLQESRNYHKAEHFFLRALKLRPTHMHSLHKYGRILLYVKGDALAAEKSFKAALENAPHHMPVLIDYAHMLLSFWKQLGISRRKGVDRAVDVLDRIVQINHNHLHGLHLLAVIEHFIRGRASKAERYYRRVLERSPKHLPTLPKYGILLLQLGKWEQAEEVFKRMLDLEPKSPPLDGLVYYGHLLRIHRHDDAQASVMYTRALHMRPTKSVPMSPDEATRCWLCSNATATQLSGLCCGTSSVVSRDMWWLEPALWQADTPQIDFDQNRVIRP